jgi:Cellulase (glycosyl hydrolase family 5)
MALRTSWHVLRLAALSMVCALLLSLFIPSAPRVARAAPAGWTASGTQVLNPAGSAFTITGINWYGFETTGYVAHGLYAHDYPYIVNEIKQYGYNTIRIPFSNQMWEADPVPNHNTISACPSCTGTHSRDILANIINYAGSIGLHVILDNHRSEAGNSAEKNGLWYTSSYPEQSWLTDWVNMQRWVHGVRQTQGAADTVTVSDTASDGFPTVLGYELRNEPHTPSRTAYLQGATWGTGDGIAPTANPNPNPFAPACVASSTCHDWRLAAERAADTLLGDAASRGYDAPLTFVDGISQYPVPGGTPSNGPYDFYWWGGDLMGVNGNTKGTVTNPGAPVVENAGGTATSLGPAVGTQLVYSAHDFGPSEFQQGWFNSNTCYTTGCSTSSLADVWNSHWAYINAGGVNPVWSSGAYPWGNTGSTAYAQAPMYLGEYGTGNTSSDLFTSGAGSQGQWFTDIVNFIQSSYTLTPANNSGIAVKNLQWSYWALNTEDSYALLGSGYTGLANPTKEYSFLCMVQQGPFAIPPGSGNGQCGSTGALPGPK